MAISDVMSKSLISASSSIKAARMQNGIKKQMEDKQKELEKTEKKAAKVENMTLDTLSAINSDLKKTAKEDLEEARAEKRAEKKKAEKSAEQKRADKKEREERMEKSSDPEKEERIKDSEPNNNPTDTVFVNIIADSMTPSTGTIDPIGTKVDVNA